MNLPNLLTISRIGIAVVMVYLILLASLPAYILAAIFFTIASITDFYDGYLAKKLGMTSDFGKIMDPIADKILMLSVFSVLAHVGIIAWWMIAVIALREVAVTVDRLWCMSQGLVIAAEQAGKVKTFFQMTTVSFILLMLILQKSHLTYAWTIQISNHGWWIVNLFMIITVGITIVSGVSYFLNRRRSQSK